MVHLFNVLRLAACPVSRLDGSAVDGAGMHRFQLAGGCEPHRTSMRMRLRSPRTDFPSVMNDGRTLLFDQSRIVQRLLNELIHREGWTIG